MSVSTYCNHEKNKKNSGEKSTGNSHYKNRRRVLLIFSFFHLLEKKKCNFLSPYMVTDLCKPVNWIQKHGKAPAVEWSALWCRRQTLDCFCWRPFAICSRGSLYSLLSFCNFLFPTHPTSLRTPPLTHYYALGLSSIPELCLHPETKLVFLYKLL